MNKIFDILGVTTYILEQTLIVRVIFCPVRKITSISFPFMETISPVWKLKDYTEQHYGSATDSVNGSPLSSIH